MIIDRISINVVMWERHFDFAKIRITVTDGEREVHVREELVRHDDLLSNFDVLFDKAKHEIKSYLESVQAKAGATNDKPTPNNL